MNSVLVTCAFISVAFHVYAFFLESIKFRDGAYKAFGVKTEHVDAVTNFAYNQGFYNLFLAMMNMHGLYSIYYGDSDAQLLGKGEMIASSFCMAGAGLILFQSGGTRMLKIALIQGLPPLIIVLIHLKFL